MEGFAYLCSYAFVLGQLLGFFILPLFNFRKQRLQPLRQCVGKVFESCYVNSIGCHLVKTRFAALLRVVTWESCVSGAKKNFRELKRKCK